MREASSVLVFAKAASRYNLGFLVSPKLLSTPWSSCPCEIMTVSTVKSIPRLSRCEKRVVGAYVKQDFVLFCFNIQKRPCTVAGLLLGGVFYNRGDSLVGLLGADFCHYTVFMPDTKIVRNGTALFRPNAQDCAYGFLWLLRKDLPLDPPLATISFRRDKSASAGFSAISRVSTRPLAACSCMAPGSARALSGLRVRNAPADRPAVLRNGATEYRARLASCSSVFMESNGTDR